LKTWLEHHYEKDLNIPVRIVKYVHSAHDEIKVKFDGIEELREYHQAKILQFMKEYQISQRHFNPSNGYGYGDDSRDALDKLFASTLGGEDALVRPQWASGTHVISDCIYALTRPGDTVLSITGRPYDTLEQVIGLGEIPAAGSLREWGIEYDQIELTGQGEIDISKTLSFLEKNNVKLILIQRSRGYTLRPSLSIERIKKAIAAIKEKHPEVMVLVDNCYGEFVELLEPCHVGADVAAGSLIKNPGGGLAPTGGYAVGTVDAIEQISYRLTCPGLGREVGSYPSSYAPFYQGLFLAPHVVGEAVKGAILAARVFEKLGYNVLPGWDEARTDIIQSILFNSPEELVLFCQAIQSISPVDSHVTPYPWDMPGYTNQVIMAAGTFVQGASIELSADAPIIPPYAAYLQGGLTYEHVKIAMMKVLTQMEKAGYINLSS
jgi:cystathionine beta-lyase family protein involved in aluminum resistance